MILIEEDASSDQKVGPQPARLDDDDDDDDGEHVVHAPLQLPIIGHFGPVRSNPLTPSSPPSYSSHIDPPPTTPAHTLSPPSPRSYPKHPGAFHPHRHHRPHHHHHHHHHPHDSHLHDHDPIAPPAPYRRFARKRFCKAFAFALLIYIALITLTHSIVRMAGRGMHRNSEIPPHPSSQDGSVLASVDSSNWTSYRPHPSWAPTFAYSAETSFSLPVTSDELYLLSRSSNLNGQVRVRQSTERRGGTDDDNVRVDVRVAYHDERVLARAAVHRLRKSGNRHGVGIYTTKSLWPLVDERERLYFDVVWTLPAPPSDDTPLRIRAFTTDMANFVHEIGDLWQTVIFDDLRLVTSNARTRVDSITLARGSVTSSNGAIVGHFNASDSLMLHTSNAAIQMTASLLSAGSEGQRNRPTQLDMRTSNGQITSSVSLTTTLDSASRWPGDFIVKARTSNGAVRLTYDDAPLGSRLASDVRTSNAHVSVGMHPAFEGRYEASTSNSQAVVRDTRAVDPSGAGRRRVVEERTRARYAVSGRVYWVGGEASRGRNESLSTVQSSNGQVELQL